MKAFNKPPYLDDCIAEIYDHFEAHTEDVALIRKLLGACAPLRIIEPFRGTGRILIPLAIDGHEITGTDLSRAMPFRTNAHGRRGGGNRVPEMHVVG